MVKRQQAYRDERLDLTPKELLKIVLGAAVIGVGVWLFMFLVAVSS